MGEEEVINYKVESEVCFWRKLPREVDIYIQLLWLAALPPGPALASQDCFLSSPAGQEQD